MCLNLSISNPILQIYSTKHFTHNAVIYYTNKGMQTNYRLLDNSLSFMKKLASYNKGGKKTKETL